MEYQRASAATSFTGKLSNGHNDSFNGKNIYDGVFGGQTETGSRVEDYAEIFGGSDSASSIPFLDVPELNQRKFSIDVSSSKLDYSSIFGDSHFAEEFVTEPIRDNKRQAKSPSFSEGSFSNVNQVSSSDGVKQFKMSYNKSNHVSKNGTNGTIHVAVPSYTCVVDEKVTRHWEKPVSSVVNEPPYGNDKFGEEKWDGSDIHCEKQASDVEPRGAGKQTSNGVDQLDGEIESNGSDCNDVLFGSFGFGHTTPPPKVRRASSMSYDKGVNNRYSLKSGNDKFGEEKWDGSDIHCEKQASDVEPRGAGKQTSNGVDQLDGEIESNGSDCNDVLFGSFGFGHTTPPPKVRRASSMSYDKGVNNHYSLKFGNDKFGEEKWDGSDIHCEKQASDVEPRGAGKQTSNGVDQLDGEIESNGSDCNDVLFGSFGFGHTTPPPKVRRASSMSYDKGVNNHYSLKFGNDKFGEEKRDGSDIHCEKQASDVEPRGAGKQTSNGVDQLDGEIESNGSDCNDVLFGSFDFGHTMPPPKVRRASSMSYNKGVNKRDSLKFGVSRSQSLDCDAGVSSPPYFDDDEVDANSVAATSAAAVKKAIEEAQARLKAMKEIMERRKGHTGRVKPSFDGSSRGEERKKGKDSVKQNKFREDHKAQDSSETIVASLLQTSDGVKMQNVVKVRQVANESEDMERGFVAREVAGGTCANNFVSSQADCRQGEEHKIIERPEVIEEATEQERKLDASEEFCVKEECLHKQMPHVELHDPREDETRLRFDELWEETEEKACNELETCEKKLEDPEKPIEDDGKVEMQELKDTDNVKRLRVDQEVVDMEDKHKHMIEVEENGYALKDVSEKEENEMLLQENSTQKEFNKISELREEHKATRGPEESNEEDACNSEDNEQMAGKIEPEIIDLRDNACDHEEEMRKLEEIGDSLGNEEFVEAEENGDMLEDVCNSEDNEQMSDKTEPEIIDLGCNACDHDEEMRKVGEISDSLGNEEFMEAEENGDLFEDAYQMEAADEVPKEAFESMETEEVQKQTVQEVDEMIEAREDALDCYWEDLEVADDASNDDKFNNIGQNSEPFSYVESCKLSTELLLNEENGGIAEGCEAYSERKETRRDSEVASDLEESLAFDKSDLAESNLKPNEIKQQAENRTDAFNLDSSIDIDTFEKDQCEQYSEKLEKIFTVEKHVEELACESENVSDGEFSLKQEENKKVRLIDSQIHCEFGEKHEATQIAHEIEAGQSTEYEEESCPQTLMKEERETKNASLEEVKLVNEEQKRIDEAKERGRQRGRGKEKQKERIAVERAIREARERAFADARERAAVGRTNIEAQRKVKAQAQGESTKPSAEANDKTFIEAKLKAERAAVERATAEARQRALEKALSEKASQSYDSRQKVSCPPATSRYQTYSNQSASKYSEGLDGAAAEPVERCKARLERHQRTSERAAKALAEKNERDLLAQKEQAERNRLAETLDAEVKRWSSGKQGNLRALLSTLQYILGSDSGWQAIPLTDIIATAAVKKAYRKATLCVHPDKLQQRGATIQQKYICEKVFDLLKEAWNRFSAEER